MEKKSKLYRNDYDGRLALYTWDSGKFEFLFVDESIYGVQWNEQHGMKEDRRIKVDGKEIGIWYGNGYAGAVLVQ